MHVGLSACKELCTKLATLPLSVHDSCLTQPVCVCISPILSATLKVLDVLLDVPLRFKHSMPILVLGP